MKNATQAGEAQRYLTFKGILFVLLFGVVVPITLVTSAGIVVIILGRSTVALVTGILVTSLAAMVFTGVFIIIVLLRRGIRRVREQETFLSNVTHELRTPLTAIRMYTQTLRMGRAMDQEKVTQCLDTILSEAAKLEGLIDRVLLWRRIAEGQQVYRMESCPIRVPVEDALESFRGMVGKTSVELDVVHEKETLDVPLDRSAVADAVLNLLYNAFKYTGEKKEIAIETKNSEGGVRISVSDNGPGISSEAQKKIFDRYYRAKAPHGADTSGTGLGLAIVKHVMDAHKGRYTVRSEVGKGSEFVLFFPAKTGRG